MIDAFGPPASSAAGDSASEGYSGAAARADHTHAREAADANLSSTAGNISQIDVADSASAGALTTGARSDHQHALPAPAAPAVLGSAAATGSAATVARADHVHAAAASWSLTASNQGIELGAVGSSNTPYVDFHSGATGTDYDTRIIASGGTGTTGKGTLSLHANFVQLGLSGNNSGTDLLACDGTNEGGQANFKGAAAHADASIDNYQSNLRFLASGGAPYVLGSSGEHFSKRDNRLVETGQGGSMIKSGSDSITFSASPDATATLTFTGDAFGAAPNVVLTVIGGTGATGGTMRVSATTTTTASIVARSTTSISATWTYHWIAVGTT